MPILANVIQAAFSPLIKVFEEIMVFIHNHLVGGSWGLAIVGLTVLVRAILAAGAVVRLRAIRGVVACLLPGLVREGFDGRVERRKDGGVGGQVGEQRGCGGV